MERPRVQITGNTRIYGILGWPVHHTLSPVMHNAAFLHQGLDCCYLPFPVPPENLPAAVAGLRPLGIQGVNVTVPHKEAVLSCLDTLDAEAQRMGAVNTVEIWKGRLVGHNTDGKGFLRALLEVGWSPEGWHVALIGSGGAARAVALSLAQQGIAGLVLLNRTPERSRHLAQRVQERHPDLPVRVAGLTLEEARPALEDVDLLVQTTPLGLSPQDPLPLPPEAIPEGIRVMDLLYHLPKTPFLSAAQARGCEIQNGLGMLLYQGVLAYEIWTDRDAPVAVMRQALEEALAQHGA